MVGRLYSRKDFGPLTCCSLPSCGRTFKASRMSACMQRCLYSLTTTQNAGSQASSVQHLLTVRRSPQMEVAAAAAAASTWAIDCAPCWQPPAWQFSDLPVRNSNADIEQKCRLLTRRIQGAQQPSTVAMLWYERPQHFNRIHLAAALSRLAHMHLTAAAVAAQQGAEPQPVMQEVVHQLLTAACSKGLRRREVSIVLWAIVSLQHVAQPQLMAELCHLVQRQWVHMKAQDCGMCAWALAKLQYHPGTAWLDQLTQQVQSKINSMDAQALVNVLWALQTFRHQPSAEWLQAASQRITSLLHKLTPQGHANAVWALAGMGQPIPAAWMQHIELLITADVHSFLPSELSMLVFGLARSSRNQPGLSSHNDPRGRQQPQRQALPQSVLQQAEGAALGWLQQLTCAQAGCLLWGFAHLNHLPSPAFLKAFFCHTQPLLATADATTLANIVLALQRVQQQQRVQLQQQQQLQQKAGRHRETEVVQALQGSVKCQVPDAWWQDFLQATHAQLPQMSLRMCVQSAYSLSQLGVQVPEVFVHGLLSMTHVSLQQQQAAATELMCLAVALGRWQARPPACWVLAFMQAFKAVLSAVVDSSSSGGVCMPHHTSRIVFALAQMGVSLEVEVQQLVARQFWLQSHLVQGRDVHRMQMAAVGVPQLIVSSVNKAEQDSGMQSNA